MNHYDDLRHLVTAEGPFVTISLPTPSGIDDARHRLEINWKNARRELESSRWTADDLADLDAAVAALPHDGGDSLVLVRAGDGSMLAEFLDEPAREPLVAEGPLPRLASVIHARQRAISHIVVHADRAGADIHTYDGGTVVSREQVEGDTEFIHRGHAGGWHGWSQGRFQQRAENTWERNADDVAAEIVGLSRRFESELIFVAGDVRAQHMVLESLPDRERSRTTLIEAGSPEGIAEEVARLLADHVARGVRELVGHLKDRLGTGMASTDVEEVLAALEAGRVERLLVHDDGADDVAASERQAVVPVGARAVDAAIVAALRSDAAITIVPGVAVLDGPIAATYRW